MQITSLQNGVKVIAAQVLSLTKEIAVYNWAGLDGAGTPIGFSSNLGSRTTAPASLINFENSSKQSSSSILKVSQNGYEILLSQDLYLVDGKLTATILPISPLSGDPVRVISSTQSVSDGPNGSKLIISSLKLDNTGSNGGEPSAINVRIQVSADEFEILAQSAQILFTGSTQSEGVI